MKREFYLLSTMAILLALVSCTDTEDLTDLTPPTLLSPPDGATITDNPPTFVWGAVEGDSCDLVYLLEVASDSTFAISSIILTTMITLPDTAFTPFDAFVSGTYYWHMCTRQNT